MAERPINQCDGCRRGLPVVRGIHRGPGICDLICCTRDRYEPAPSVVSGAPSEGKNRLSGERLAELFRAREGVRRAEASGVQANVVRALNRFWDLCDSDTSMDLLDLLAAGRRAETPTP